MHTLKTFQKLPLSLQECWDFFSSPHNLKILTPEHLKFEMTGNLEPCKMYAGQIICYKIRPLLNLPLSWVTEITHVQEPSYFVDEQRFGPYKFWHHEHRFIEIPNGVEMQDTVYYALPYGPLGSILHSLKVKKDIETIFSYRKEKLVKMFGSL